MNAPSFIDHLEPNQIIVVGTNYAGNHAGGAARYAKEHFGLHDGCGEGLSGQTYGLPSMNGLQDLYSAVLDLADFATFNTNLTFLLTKVGCGIAGHPEEDVKKLFKDMPGNVWLPEGWER